MENDYNYKPEIILDLKHLLKWQYYLYSKI